MIKRTILMILMVFTAIQAGTSNSSCFRVSGSPIIAKTLISHNRINTQKWKPLSSWDKFVHLVGFYESGNNWNIVSPTGYLGYFQFGKPALRSVGYDIDGLGREPFLNDSLLQIKCFKKLLAINKKNGRKLIRKWSGKTAPQTDFIATESGILMACHLVGLGNVQVYYGSNGQTIPKDGNGVPVTKYLRVFSGFALE